MWRWIYCQNCCYCWWWRCLSQSRRSPRQMWSRLIISWSWLSLNQSLLIWNQRNLNFFIIKKITIKSQLLNLCQWWINPCHQSYLRSLSYFRLLLHWKCRICLSCCSYGNFFQIYGKSWKRSFYGRSLSRFSLIRRWIRRNCLEISQRIIWKIRRRFSLSQSWCHRFRKQKISCLRWNCCWI